MQIRMWKEGAARAGGQSVGCQARVGTCLSACQPRAAVFWNWPLEVGVGLTKKIWGPPIKKRRQWASTVEALALIDAKYIRNPFYVSRKI